MNTKKKKISIDFLLPEYSLLSRQAKANGQSNSCIINELVGTFLPLVPELKKELATYCADKYLECISELQRLSGYESQDIAIVASQWKTLENYFHVNVENLPNTNMKKIQLKDGYCIVPKDFVILGDIFGRPEECLYAGVVESRNSKTYGIPQFLFFCNTKYAREYTDELEAKVYKECEKVFPEFKKLYNMQIDLKPEEENDENRIAEWDKAPRFGMFHLVEKGDPVYWNSLNPNYNPPYGAMIVRTQPVMDKEYNR